MNKGLETLKTVPFVCEEPKTVSMIFPDEINDIEKSLKVLEIIKETCEFDFIKEEVNDKPTRYEIHIRRKGKDNIFFPCLAIYPKSQEEYDLLKEILK